MDNFQKYIQQLIDFLIEIDSGAYFVQTNFLNELLDLIKANEYTVFYDKVNSIELWGGSGSLWESEYGMTTEQRSYFDKLLVNLLEELRSKDKIGKQAKGRYKILIQFRNKMSR